jgi:hypothetical protein
MTDVLVHIAETARSWGTRADLPEGDRHFADQVGELAAFLSRRPFPHEDDMDSLRILGCRLCQRVGEARCRDQANDCCLGLPQLV